MSYPGIAHAYAAAFAKNPYRLLPMSEEFREMSNKYLAKLLEDLTLRYPAISEDDRNIIVEAAARLSASGVAL